MTASDSWPAGIDPVRPLSVTVKDLSMNTSGGSLWPLVIILAGLTANLPQSICGATFEYLSGHADIGLGYDSVSGPRLFLQFGGDAVATGLTTEQLIAGEKGGVLGEWTTSAFVTVVPQSVEIARPDGVEWDFLGAAAGQPIWVFSQQSQSGVPFLGFNTEKAAGGSGTYTLGNVITRPAGGEVSLFQLGGFGAPDAVYWATVLPDADEVTVPPQTHVHYAFGFSQPGYYEVSVFGTGSGFPGQAEGTLAFRVVGASTDIVIDVPTGSQTQTQAGYPIIGSATSVTKTGAGTLVMDAANTYAGPTTVSAGTLAVAAGNALLNTSVTVGIGGTLAIAADTTMRAPAVLLDEGTLAGAALDITTFSGIGSLVINAGTLAGAPAINIAGGGQMALAQDARLTVGFGSLAIDQNAGGGRLDVGAGQVTIASGGITAAALRTDLLAGRASGNWNGPTGIMSSTAAAAGGTRAVGYVVASNGSATVSFAALGDVDLNGQVNVFDLVSINSSGTYGTGAASVWGTGDFNYDGVTNVFDLVGINTAAVYGQGVYFPAAPTAAGVGSATVVPEPTPSLVLAAGIATSSFLSRRRKIVKALRNSSGV
jgi:autotransporter-associated beta strand protein